jgi:DNA-binding XRE family transcriptional regulator
VGAQVIEIAGEKMAVLPVAEYERLIELAEDNADVIAAEKAAERRRGGEEYLPAELVDRILDGENPLRVWRQYRNLSLKQLAEKSGVGLSYISELERGLKNGPGHVWAKLSRSLNVTVEDILPDEED